MLKQKLINIKSKLSLIWGNIPQRNRKLIVIFFIFLSLTLAITIFLTRQSQQTITYKPKASDQNQPDQRCSLEIEVEDVQAEPTPALTDTPTSKPTQTTTPKPTATKTPTATPTLCPIVASGDCPETLPLPKDNAYPYIKMTSVIIGTNTYSLPNAEVLTIQESQAVKVNYSAQRVFYRKICRIACADANDKATCDYANGWTNCMGSSEGGFFSYQLPTYIEGGKNDYHLLIAGYSADDNYSCSNQQWYTAGEHNQAVVSCSLGTACCQNQVIKLRVSKSLD